MVDPSVVGIAEESTTPVLSMLDTGTPSEGSSCFENLLVVCCVEAFLQYVKNKPHNAFYARKFWLLMVELHQIW